MQEKPIEEENAKNFDIKSWLTDGLMQSKKTKTLLSYSDSYDYQPALVLVSMLYCTSLEMHLYKVACRRYIHPSDLKLVTWNKNYFLKSWGHELSNSE